MDYDAFISYARDDGQDRAERLKADLETRGYQVYLDLYENEPGIEWWGRIEDAIARSRALLFIITERSVGSAVCKREWTTAADLKKPLLPIKIVDRRGKIIADTDIPDHIGKLHYIDTTQDWAEGVDIIDGLLTRYAYLADLGRALQVEIDRSTATRYIEILSQSKPEAVKDKTMRRHFRIASVHARPTEILAYETFDACWNAHPNGVLLLGDPGAGKTTTLLHQAQYLIGAYLADRNQSVPVYDRITAWNPDENRPLDDWLVTTNDLPPDMKKVMQTGRAILILDGLDELGRSRPEDPKDPNSPKYDPRKRFMERVQEMINRGNRVLITCRVKDYDEIGEQFAGIGAVVLQDLTDEQIEGYLGDVPAVQEAVRNDSALRGICRSPLLLSLIAFGYRDAPAKLQSLSSLKEGVLRDAIFGQYITTSYTYESRRRAARGETTPFTLEKVLEVLGQAAMINASGGRRNDSKGRYGDASEIAENVLIRHDFIHRLEDEQISLFCDLACDLHILYHRDKETYGFLHLLLRNYLAYVYSSEHLQDRDCYPDHANYPSPAKAMAGVGDARSIESLIHILTDGDTRVRMSAANALGQLGDTRAVEPLSHVLADPDTGVMMSAAYALGALGEPGLQLLLNALTHENENARASSAHALGVLGDARAFEPLSHALDDPETRVRMSAAYALGALGDARALEPLLRALSDPGPGVMMSAAYGLTMLGDDHAIDLANRTLSDFFSEADVNSNTLELFSEAAALIHASYYKDSRFHRVSAFALGQLGDSRAVEPLIQILANTNETWSMRSIAIYYLEDLKDLRAVEPLIHALSDTQVEVRGSAAEVLGTLGSPRAVPALVERLDDRERGQWERVCDYAAEALRKIGTPEALAAVEAWERKEQSSSPGAESPS